MIIIWLCTWALNAARAGQFSELDRFGSGFGGGFDSDGDEVCFMGTCVDVGKRSIQKRAVRFKTLKGLLGGTAGVGAIIW